MVRYFLISVMLICSFIACTKKDDSLGLNTDSEGSATGVLQAQDLSTDINGLSHVEGVIKTVHGNIIFKFYPRKSPNTVTRILQLIQSGFYDGLLFHRVIPNFIVQTGSPQGDPNGGTGNKITAEINDLRHVKGSMAMARFDLEPDSADSQFYIVLDTLPHLDGKFTIFGQVVDGLDVVEKIVQGDKVLSISLNLKNQKQ
jgi:cyclophilin family peptidyl-prolyl cis-trans isomerase